MDSLPGLVQVYTGEGGGKTTSALGLALRMLGHNKKVVIVQFMKGRKETGEYIMKEALGKNYEIAQFGREEFVNLSNPDEKDKELGRKALEFAKEALKQKPELLILDEVNIAAAAKIVDAKEVAKLVLSAPEKTSIVMTGRYAPKELIEIADIVIEHKVLKCKQPVPYIEGIQY